MPHSFLIAAASSNSGKTTVAIGLLRALRNRSLRVQPYKCGPDYIDTMLHRMASGRESVNLDTFMSSGDHVRSLHLTHSADADVSVIEGVMGMYDGYDKWKGSSADVAQTLDVPVVLVVSAKSVAYSVAPIIYGFKRFNSGIRIAGVIFNQVASDSHYHFLREACEDAGVECLGYLPRNERLAIPSRHLGLTIQAEEDVERLLRLAAEEVEKHVDIDRLLSLCCEKGCDGGKKAAAPRPLSSLKILVAKDNAFNFTYKANVDALCRLGVVESFSPLSDAVLPPCDILYLPGGYPELFLDQLVSNASMREQIRNYAEGSGRIFAECGGFMYLCSDIDGRPMCGVLPLRATMEGARLHLGYRQMNWAGLTVKGHEFHYSKITDEIESDGGVEEVRMQLSAKGSPVGTPVYKYKNVTAGYTHWYWGDKTPEELSALLGLDTL